MKTSKTILFVLSCLFLTLFSCNPSEEITEQEYLITVDSIQCQDTVKVLTPFKLVFYGIIGENGCYRFSRFHTENIKNMIEIQTIGLKKVGPNLVCPELLPLLDGQELELKADSIGELKLKVMNPGVNRFITKNIVVVP
ncbi:MAG: hypothetical protein H3C41_11490 [Bacteroidales bacterium]|nr:hypothetical protein [Bacteroidales bacterium]